MPGIYLKRYTIRKGRCKLWRRASTPINQIAFNLNWIKIALTLRQISLPMWFQNTCCEPLPKFQVPRSLIRIKTRRYLRQRQMLSAHLLLTTQCQPIYRPVSITMALVVLPQMADHALCMGEQASKVLWTMHLAVKAAVMFAEVNSAKDTIKVAV